jgi:hypothetical protein
MGDKEALEARLADLMLDRFDVEGTQHPIGR